MQPPSIVHLVALPAFLFATPLMAQEGPVTFEFSFSNPGARSLAMGGAFAALADDATAAFANPAGLTQLHDAEFSLETRSWSYETPFVEGGRIAGEPTGLGVDTVAGIRTTTASSDATSLSFASFIYPRDRWSFALYRHTWADFNLRSHVNGLFGLNEDGEDERSEDVVARTDVEVFNLGFSAGYQLTPTLSIGGGVVRYDATIDSISVEYRQPEELLYESGRFLDEHIDTNYFHQSDTSGIDLNVGFLWQFHPEWSLGGYYREGPSLDFHVLEIVGEGHDEHPAGLVELDRTTSLDLPDVFGLGLAYRDAEGRWTASFEWSRVGYSSITDSLDTTVFDAGQIRIDDGNEFRAGVEYVFLEASPVIALRLGAWLDPAHSVGSGSQAGPFERAIFPGGDDEIHIVGGVGLAFDRFQIDLGADLSQNLDSLSLSLVYRF